MKPPRSLTFSPSNVNDAIKNYKEAPDNIALQEKLQRELTRAPDPLDRTNAANFLLRTMIAEPKSSFVFDAVGAALLDVVDPLLPEVAAPFVRAVAKHAAATPLGETAEAKYELLTGPGLLQRGLMRPPAKAKPTGLAL